MNKKAALIIESLRSIPESKSIEDLKDELDKLNRDYREWSDRANQAVINKKMTDRLYINRMLKQTQNKIEKVELLIDAAGKQIRTVKSVMGDLKSRGNYVSDQVIFRGIVVEEYYDNRHILVHINGKYTKADIDKLEKTLKELYGNDVEKVKNIFDDRFIIKKITNKQRQDDEDLKDMGDILNRRGN